jgi:hypothetical protein
MNFPENGASDPDDAWMYFGSFSEREIAGATARLRECGVSFEGRKEPDQSSYAPKGWTGPFALWVSDDDCLRAQELLIPFLSDEGGQPRTLEEA